MGKLDRQSGALGDAVEASQISFHRLALTTFLATGAVLSLAGVWMAVTGPTTSVRPFTSEMLVRVLGVGATVGGVMQLVPAISMFLRRRQQPIKVDSKGVLVRAVSLSARRIAWDDVDAIGHKQYGVFVTLRSGHRVKIYHQVLAIKGQRAASQAIHEYLSATRSNNTT